MRTAAVIAEYNPIHNGHLSLLRAIRERGGADSIVVVMSGDFVQRGEPAVVNKYVRTEMALRAGADLVIELPVAAASGSAQRFAEGAAAQLEALGCVDELWFGSEAGNISPFLAAAEILAEEPEGFRTCLRRTLADGQVSFAEARAAALAPYLEKAGTADAGAFLRAPNNILGLEYCLALRKAGSSIRPVTVRREGSGYHEDSLPGGSSFASASAIRSALLAGTPAASLEKWIPTYCASLLEKERLRSGLMTSDDFSEMLHYQLLREDAASLASCLDLPPSLANRILHLLPQFRSWTQFAELLKTRERARTAVDRALLHVLLQIRQEDLERVLHPSMVRVLGMDPAGLLPSLIKKKASAAFVTKASSLKDYPYEKDLFASHLYEAVCCSRTGRDLTHEYSRQLVLVSS